MWTRKWPSTGGALEATVAKSRRHVRQAGRRKGPVAGQEKRSSGGWLGAVGGYLRQSWQRRRALGPREILIWVTVAVVAGAFLLLLAQYALLVAIVVLVLVVTLGWRELTRPA